MKNTKKTIIKNVGVFCGSAIGGKDIYGNKAEKLGALLAKNDITLVYGAANIGLMGILANSVIDNGGKVIGVITEKLADVDLAHKYLAELRVVKTMSERKTLMTDLSDAFIILPGGYGTFDELFEVLTLCQLNIIHKPIGLLNVEGYFDPLILLIRHSIKERFIRHEHGDLFVVDEDENLLLRKIEDFQPVETIKWLKNFKSEKY